MPQRISLAPFDGWSWGNQIIKLEWELSNVNHASGADPVRYAGMALATGNLETLRFTAINFLVTAWHMVDWIARAAEGNAALADRISQTIAGATGQFDVERLRRYVLDPAKNKKLDQRAIRMLANAAKHGETMIYRAQPDHPDDPQISSVRTSGSGEILGADLGYLVGPVPEPSEQSKVMLMIDGIDTELMPMFRQILNFWKDFTAQHQMT